LKAAAVTVLGPCRILKNVTGFAKRDHIPHFIKTELRSFSRT